MLLHSERPKLHTVLAFLSAIELNAPAYSGFILDVYESRDPEQACMHRLV